MQPGVLNHHLQYSLLDLHHLVRMNNKVVYKLHKDVGQVLCPAEHNMIGRLNYISFYKLNPTEPSCTFQEINV